MTSLFFWQHYLTETIDITNKKSNSLGVAFLWKRTIYGVNYLFLL